MKSTDTQDRQTQFGLWLGIPVSARKDDEKTEQQIAAKLGVNRRSISRWKQLPYVKEVAQSAIKLLGGNEKLAIVNSMVAKAKEGSFQHQRLYLEWQGEIGTRREDGKPPSEIKVSFITEQK